MPGVTEVHQTSKSAKVRVELVREQVQVRTGTSAVSLSSPPRRTISAAGSSPMSSASALQRQHHTMVGSWSALLLADLGSAVRILQTAGVSV